MGMVIAWIILGLLVTVYRLRQIGHEAQAQRALGSSSEEAPDGSARDDALRALYRAWGAQPFEPNTQARGSWPQARASLTLRARQDELQLELSTSLAPLEVFFHGELRDQQLTMRAGADPALRRRDPTRVPEASWLLAPDHGIRVSQVTWSYAPGTSQLKATMTVELSEQLSAGALLAWADQLKAGLCQAIEALRRPHAQLVQALWAAPPQDPLGRLLGFYLAACAHGSRQDPAWLALEDREAELWALMPTTMAAYPSVEKEPVELLQRVGIAWSDKALRTLRERGELARALDQGTLGSPLALAWLLNEGATLRAHQPHLEASILARLGQDQLTQWLTHQPPHAALARLRDPEDALHARPELLMDALEALTGPASASLLGQGVALLLSRHALPDHPKRLHSLDQLLEVAPELLSGPRQERYLRQLSPPQLWQRFEKLCARLDAWSLCHHVLQRPALRDDLLYEVPSKTHGVLWRALLGHDPSSPRADHEFLALWPLIHASPRDPEHLRGLERYLELLARRGLARAQGPALRALMDASSEHRDALRDAWQRWEVERAAREPLGALTLSEAPDASGALTVSESPTGALTQHPRSGDQAP